VGIVIRRLFIAGTIGVLAALVATPAEAAEWCLHDPALVFAVPHSKHKITIYATEGVQGAQHEQALKKAHIDFEAKHGKRHGTMRLIVRAHIPDEHHQRFATVLVVSSEPFGEGTVYGVVMGQSGREMKLDFVFVYQDGG
jgi:hypothetical protein